MENKTLCNLLSIIVFIGVSGCSSFPKSSTLLEPEGNNSNLPILFVADPQIHNIYGLGLKQMTGISDIFSKVAVRPPELNILSPLVLENLISKSNEKHKSRAIVVLGDATNIACSGEYHTFIESLNRGNSNNLPVFMAHGNHDSYLMGTVNHYFPDDFQLDWKPENMESSLLPTDESWWGTSSKINSNSRRNWRDGCFQPSLDGESLSTPMNKSRWLAKYILLLENTGLTKILENEIAPKTNDGGILMSFSADVNSALGINNFSAKGYWYQPDFKKVPSKSYFTGTYKSFLVQKMDFDDIRMIIIDTSVCEKARGGVKFIVTNAGQNACIGQSQFKIIEEYAAQTPKDYKLAIAGHFPLSDLSKKENKQLLGILSEKKDWVYMSAHSHKPTSQLDWGTGLEINIGSTTDWPMEANNVWFYADKSVPAVSTITSKYRDIPRYTSVMYNGKSEVCRHLAAAKKLALIKDFDIITNWQSPEIDKTCKVSDSKSWDKFGSALSDYIEKVYMRFRSDTKYRNAMLKIAAAASKSEMGLANFIP